MRSQSSKLTPLFLLMALSSGAAALVYETVWLRWFKILFGNTAYAASVTLAAFFTGLSIGAVIFGRISQRRLHCLRLYGWLEIGIIIGAFLVPFTMDLYDAIYPYLYDHLRTHRIVFLLVKFLLAFLVILPTSFLLGGTLPLMVRAYLHDKHSLGKEGNRLYSTNTLGAVAGTALGALWLPELMGVNLTYGVGMLLSLTSALLAFILSSQSGRASTATESVTTSSRTSTSLLMIAAASGFGTLALEVLLMHALSQMFDNSVYSIGAILIIVLSALAIAAAFVSVTAQRISVATMLRTALISQAGIVMVLPWLSSYLLNYYGFVPGTLSNGLFFALVLGGPGLFVGGLIFPLTFRMAKNDAAGHRIGGLLAVNTLGGIAGSTIAGFLLLETIGIWWSLMLLGIAYGLAAIFVDGKTFWRLASGAITLVLVATVFLSPANPNLLSLVSLNSTELLIDSAQGPHGMISVVHRPLYDDYRIKLNNHYTLSGSSVQTLAERAGHLPLVLHPSPKTVAFIGSATGITAGASMAHQIDTVELIELVPEVQKLASKYFGQFNRNIYQDPRTEIVTEDGRNHIRATQQQYDVVVADLFVPWRPGVGSLYTREHFQAVNEHLATGGIFCQWLPVFQLRQQDIDMILATFHDVFPEATLWRGNFSASFPRLALIGKKGDWASAAQIEERTKELSHVVADRWVTHPKAIWMLYMGALNNDLIKHSKMINTDNNPAFEYLVARSTFDERMSYINSGGWLEFGNRVQRKAGTVSDWPKWGTEAGQLYTHADAQFVKDHQKRQGASRKLIDLLEELHRHVPKELLSFDPSVADVRPQLQ